MKKGTSYSKRERRIISLGYLWRWGSIVFILVSPLIASGICGLLRITALSHNFIKIAAMGVTMLCVGVYEIVGTALEFRHLHVALKLTYHVPYNNINPRSGWTKEEKREYIGAGIIFAVLGLGATIVATLVETGVIK